MPAAPRTEIHFQGIPGPVRLLPGAAEGTGALLSALRRVLGCWPHACRDAAATDAAPPLFLVEPLPDGDFRLHGASPEATDFTPFRPQDACARLRPGYSYEPSLACLVSTLAIELVAAYEAQTIGLMGIHAAAAVRDGRTVLLCGTHRAGKSALMARLLLGGWQGLGDDMLALSPAGELFSYGFAPRLRLPLPACGRLAPLLAPDSPLVACRDEQYLCCDPARLPMLPWGTLLPPDAVVILDRQEKPAACGLLPQSRQDDMRDVLLRFLLRDGRAGLALRTACDLLQRAPCRLLRYRTLDEAAGLLDDWLAASPGAALPAPDTPTPGPAPLSPRRTGERRPPLFRHRGRAGRRSPDTPTGVWRQRPGVTFRQAGDEGFLARDEDVAGRDGRVFRLNGMGCILWQLWEEPGGDAELAGLLAEAFPQVSPERIRRDVAVLRQRLGAAGFLQRIDDDAAPGPDRAAGASAAPSPEKL